MADIRSGIPALSLYTRPPTAPVAAPATAPTSAPASAPSAPAAQRPRLTLQKDTYTPSSAAAVEPSARERLQLMSVHRGAEASLGAIDGMLRESYGV
jgi:hypothetical protein